MTNILKYDLLDAAEFRRTVAPPTLTIKLHVISSSALKEWLLRMPPLLVQKYRDCLNADPDKLNRIKRAIMYKIGYDFTPKHQTMFLLKLLSSIRKQKVHLLPHNACCMLNPWLFAN